MAKKKPVKITKPSYSDDHLGKPIEIKCKGSDVLSIDQLTEFRGKLKKLSEDAYVRLKQSILELGFSFPIAAWKHRNKTFILDAHQRVAVLKRMRDEGYVIPPLPVVWVEARDPREAARKVLAATSQYGEVQVDGLHSFMEEFKLTMPDLEQSYKFPEVDLESFRLTYFHVPAPPVVIGETVPAVNTAPPPVIRRPGNSPEGPPVTEMGLKPTNAFEEWKGMPEFIQEDKTGYRHVIVHFTNAEAVREFFNRIGQSYTDKTKTVWFPPQERMDTESRRYEED